jgi:hypothetical protein
LAQTGPDPLVLGPEGVEEGWHTEDWLTGECGPLKFSGKVDLHRPPADGPLKVFDWKTASDPDADYNPNTSNKLAKKAQPLIYASVLGKLYGVEGDTVDVRYIFVGRHDPEYAIDVNTEITWPAIEERWAEFVEMAEEMAQYAVEAEGPDDVPANISKCRKYGRCDHWDICSASPANRIAAMYSNPTHPVTHTVNPEKIVNTTDALAKLKALAAQSGNTPTATVEPTEPVEQPTKTEQHPAVAVGEQLNMMLGLASFAEGIPEATVKVMAESAGLMPFMVTEAAGLVLKNGKFVPRPEVVAEEVEPATTVEVAPEVAAAIEVIAEVRAEGVAAEQATSDDPLDITATWLRENVEPGGAVPFEDVRAGFLEVLPDRKRLGASFIAKACTHAGPAFTSKDGDVARSTATVTLDRAATAVRTLLDTVAAGPTTTEVVPTLAGKVPAQVAAAPAAPKVAQTSKIVVIAKIVVIDGAAENAQATPLAEWLRPLEEEVLAYAKKTGLKGAESGHWGCIEFNKGFGLMSVAIRESIEELPPLLSVDTRQPLAGAFLEQLFAAGEKAGALIIRGNK